MIYISKIDGLRVDAEQVTGGDITLDPDVHGDRVTATRGDYIITDPWVEVVDEETFHQDFEGVST